MKTWIGSIFKLLNFFFCLWFFFIWSIDLTIYFNLNMKKIFFMISSIFYVNRIDFVDERKNTLLESQTKCVSSFTIKTYSKNRLRNERKKYVSQLSSWAHFPRTKKFNLSSAIDAKFRLKRSPTDYRYIHLKTETVLIRARNTPIKVGKAVEIFPLIYPQYFFYNTPIR